MLIVLLGIAVCHFGGSGRWRDALWKEDAVDVVVFVCLFLQRSRIGTPISVNNELARVSVGVSKSENQRGSKRRWWWWDVDIFRTIELVGVFMFYVVIKEDQKPAGASLLLTMGMT